MIETYLSENDIKRFTSVTDQELNTLFQEVREKFDNKYYLEESTHVIKKMFRKPKEYTKYTLYYDTILPSVQVINFPSEKGGIRECADKSLIMALFFGLLNGLEQGNRKLKKAKA